MGAFKALSIKIDELTYTPTTQQVIESILNNYDEDQMVMTVGPNLVKVKFYDYEGNLENTVNFKLVGKYDDREKSGVHTFPEDDADLEFRIQNAIESCERDLFETVYIHVNI